MVSEENILVTKVSDLREEEMDSQVKTGRRLLLFGNRRKRSLALGGYRFGLSSGRDCKGGLYERRGFDYVCWLIFVFEGRIKCHSLIISEIQRDYSEGSCLSQWRRSIFPWQKHYELYDAQSCQVQSQVPALSYQKKLLKSVCKENRKYFSDFS